MMSLLAHLSSVAGIVGFGGGGGSDLTAPFPCFYYFYLILFSGPSVEYQYF